MDLRYIDPQARVLTYCFKLLKQSTTDGCQSVRARLCCFRGLKALPLQLIEYLHPEFISLFCSIQWWTFKLEDRLGKQVSRFYWRHKRKMRIRRRKTFDWCYLYYFTRNGLLILLEALFFVRAVPPGILLSAFFCTHARPCTQALTHTHMHTHNRTPAHPHTHPPTHPPTHWYLPKQVE